MENKEIINNIKTTDIIPYERNARKNDQAVKEVVKSIERTGYRTPIIIDEKNVILCGHTRLKAIQKLGWKEIPFVVQYKDLTESQKQEYRIRDNKTGEIAEWDFEILEADFSSDELIDFGFNIKDLTQLEVIEDEAPPVPEISRTVKGDIYTLGNHRVMCGDSTMIDDVEKLMDGKKADMVFTDPPYGINEKGDRSNRGGACKGNNLKDFKDDTIQYAIDAYNLCESFGIMRQVWWGANYYCHSLPQSNNWFIWDKRVEEKQKDTQSDCEMAWVKSEFNSIRIFRHLWKGMCKGSEQGQRRVHPTQKPVALAQWAFDYFKDVKSVLDLFLGSGSTLIACEQTNRICYGMELDEKYCDVIVQRWVNFTGITKILLNGQEIEWPVIQTT